MELPLSMELLELGVLVLGSMVKTTEKTMLTKTMTLETTLGMIKTAAKTVLTMAMTLTMTLTMRTATRRKNLKGITQPRMKSQSQPSERRLQVYHPFS